MAGYYDRTKGILEMLANAGTSGLAEMGGGLTYAAAAPFVGDKPAQAMKSAVQNAYTYQPRTEEARNMTGVLSSLAAPVLAPFAGAGKRLGDATYGATGSPLLGALATAAPQAALELADRANIGALRRGPAMNMREHWGTPEFNDWFGGSAAVDANGNPLVVYHGTGGDIGEFNAKGVPAIHFTNSNDNAYAYARDKGGVKYDVVDSKGGILQGGFDTKKDAMDFRRSEVGGKSSIKKVDGAPNIVPAYLSIKNPLQVDVGGEYFSRIKLPDQLKGLMKSRGWTDAELAEMLFKTDHISNMAKEAGFDGVIFRNVIDTTPSGAKVATDTYAVFNPEQVKSIFNTGAYSGSGQISR
jgi:hypothetical protein